MYSKIIMISPIALFLVISIISLQTDVVTSRPSDPPEMNSLIAGSLCTKDHKTLELCQRCAKITKSNIVYPLCCRDEDDVLNWCDDYVNFGYQPDH